MELLMNIGSAYFLSYLAAFGLDYIITLKLNETLTYICILGCKIIRFPKYIFELLFNTPQIWNVFIMVCAICFIAKILKLIIDNV